MQPLRSVTLFPCAILATLMLTSGREAKADEQQSSVFGDEIDVRVVNVEVVVTDRRGNRVTDLKPGDFRLTVDGKAVPIEFFTEVREGQAMAGPAPPEAAPSQAVSGLPSVEPGHRVGTHYLVFIDEYFAIAPHRDVVLASLKKDLGRLGAEDRMSVVAWNGARIHRLADWTGDRKALADAFERAAARPTRGADRRADYNSFLDSEKLAAQANGDDSATDPALQGAGGMSLAQIAYGTTLVRQIQSAVSAVVSSMRASSPPTGRKVMLLLSGGWPYSVATYVQSGEVSFLTGEIPDGEHLLRPLTNAANLLGYTIYPVDMPGVTSMAADASQNPAEGRGSSIVGDERNFRNASLRPQEEPGIPLPSQTGDFLEQEVEGTLQYIAKETGGQPALNGNRLAVLSRANADTRSYYWLGFSPAWQRNNQRHKVEVEVLRPGLKARSRKSFLDLSRQAEVAMMIESALLFGSLPGSERLALQVGDPVRAKWKGVEIPITLGIPMSAITVVPIDGKYVAEVQLWLAATDERGNQSDMPMAPLRIVSDQQPAEGKLLRYDTKVVLKGKASRIVASVYDPLSGKVASAEADLKGMVKR